LYDTGIFDCPPDTTHSGPAGTAANGSPSFVAPTRYRRLYAPAPAGFVSSRYRKRFACSREMTSRSASAPVGRPVRSRVNTRSPCLPVTSLPANV
jgi:hypothetical protein